MRYIPQDLLNKIKESEMTIYNDAEPRIEVDVARAKNSVMDSSYWTREVIREKPGVGDIEVAARRFFKHHGRPDRLYEIYIDNGTVKVGHREYPDLEKIGWQLDFDLGPGLDVAIAFDGAWKEYRGTWRFQTEEFPWLFWVNDLGDLYGQHWNDTETKTLLATNVLKVAALRGWKELNKGQNDQGIVVSYIKSDGSLWYKNYCIQLNNDYIWEYEKSITGFGTNAVNVNLFLLNDYRLGILVENDLSEIYWFITERSWVNMAVENHSINTSISELELSVIPIIYTDTLNKENVKVEIVDTFINVAEPIYPEPHSATNEEDEITIHLLFNHIIDYDLSNIKAAFTIKDSNENEFEIISTSGGASNDEIIFTVQKFSSAIGQIYIVYDRTVIELDCLNQGSRFAIESFSFGFAPVLAPPEGFSSENIYVNFLDITFSVTKISYLEGFGKENIETSIADMSIVVTQVGNNPL